VGLRARAARRRRTHPRAVPAVPPVEPEAVELVRPLGAPLLRKSLDRAHASGGAHRPHALGVARELEHRRRERLRLGDGDEQAGLAVADDVLEPADRRRDHGPPALHRLQCDHPEALAERRDDDDRRIVDRALRRRHVPEEPQRGAEVERVREVLQPALEHAAPCDVEPRLRALLEQLPERAQQDEMALDRDQAPDAEEVRAAVERPRRGPGVDAVVDDLEVRLAEALGLGEVAR